VTEEIPPLSNMIDPGRMYLEPLKPGLSGFTVVKNAIELDYSLDLCVRSMLRVCDEVVVGEMGSTDATSAILTNIMAEDNRLRVVKIRDWTLERGNAQWFVGALNDTRQHLAHEMMLQLDADEILDDRPHVLKAIRNAARDGHTLRVDRLNYFRDPQHLVPDGEMLGKYVLRIGPSRLFLPSDEPRSEEEAPILRLAQRHDDIKIHHVGFLRPQDKFYAKARVVLGAFFNEFDPRLARAEASGKPIHESEISWLDRLIPYGGYIPEDVRSWLRARGHNA
jgi:hypothetical protein